MNEYQLDFYHKCVKAGLPEVYAEMAAKNYERDYCAQETDSNLLWYNFTWEATEEGHDFWSTVTQEMQYGAST